MNNRLGLNAPQQPTVPPMPRALNSDNIHNMKRCFTVIVEKSDHAEEAIKALQNAGFWTAEISASNDPYKTFIVTELIEELREKNEKM